MWFNHTRLESTDYSDSSQLDMAQGEVKVFLLKEKKTFDALQNLTNFLPLYTADSLKKQWTQAQ